MHRWPHIIGVFLGLIIAACFLALAGGRERHPAPSGPVLSECDGHLRELVIHYEPSAKSIVAPVYRQLLAVLEAEITVHVVCPSRAAFDDLVAAVPERRCRVKPIVVQHPMTTWSRDRWLAFAPVSRTGPVTLWAPRA
ncbi:MAG TPA: hypothetical protein VJA21_13845, partial [Verrucomicrobiae bacterium]